MVRLLLLANVLLPVNEIQPPAPMVVLENERLKLSE